MSSITVSIFVALDSETENVNATRSTMVPRVLMTCLGKNEHLVILKYKPSAAASYHEHCHEHGSLERPVLGNDVIDVRGHTNRFAFDSTASPKACKCRDQVVERTTARR